jgi:hypothetical protein
MPPNKKRNACRKMNSGLFSNKKRNACRKMNPRMPPNKKRNACRKMNSSIPPTKRRNACLKGVQGHLVLQQPSVKIINIGGNARRVLCRVQSVMFGSSSFLARRLNRPTGCNKRQDQQLFTQLNYEINRVYLKEKALKRVYSLMSSHILGVTRPSEIILANSCAFFSPVNSIPRSAANFWRNFIP